MHNLSKVFLISLMLTLFSNEASSFDVNISGDRAVVGDPAHARSCEKFGEEVFTGAAGNTVYTDEESYSGGKALKLTVNEGSRGYGTLGGTISFENCEHVGGKRLYKGDELWIRTRLFFPEGFEFNVNGRNKFLRVRAFHYEDGNKVSEGYNDLYIDGHPRDEGYRPFQFIFEGEANWYTMGNIGDFFKRGEWKTVEYYLRLDNEKESEGGQAKVRVWIDGTLIGETGERRTLVTEDSFVESLYFFTYWDNEGAHKTQSFYADDIVLTSETPSERDANGYPYIGMGTSSGDTRPRPPVPLN